jgi:uncharacterized protein YoxC
MGGLELVLIVAYIAVVVAVIALPVWVLREMRRRGEQLDRIEHRLDQLEGRGGSDPR